MAYSAEMGVHELVDAQRREYESAEVLIEAIRRHTHELELLRVAQAARAYFYEEGPEVA